MRRFGMFFVVFALIVCLFASCGGDDDIIGPDDVEGLLSAMSPGDWAEHETPEGDRSIWKFIGEDTWEGTSCFVMEFEESYEGEKTVGQVWINKSSGETVLLVVEMDGELIRIDPSTMGDVPGDDTWEDDDDTEEIGTDSYTTPTGKTVDVTIYRTQTDHGVSEEWVSSEVPFMLVKVLEDGEVISSLYDFGTGASRAISKEDAENAEEFQFPTFPDDGFDDIDDIPDIPDDVDDNPPEPGVIDQAGQIVITVGPGPRPRITVSQPIKTLTVSGGNIAWGFVVAGQNPGLPGPFNYGVAPNNAVLIGVPNPPDLKQGTTYTISVVGDVGGVIPPMGTLIFVR